MLDQKRCLAISVIWNLVSEDSYVIRVHFIHNPENDLWLAPGHETFKYADGAEEFLIEVFGQTEATDYPVELSHHIHDWPSRYHLSHVRVNLLDSVSELIRPEWEVLELGAGPGTLTKWLARRTARVDVVEGSHARALANRLRTKTDMNVRVAVGDIRDLPFGDTYDLATLVGVLEYVGSGLEKGERVSACTDMLRKTRSALRPDGVLLLAIENRLGAKYWAGCREDHSSRFFDGLLEYPNSDSAITFSRLELETMLNDAGFTHQQFYHMFPDYKLPIISLRESDELARLRPYQWVRGFAEEYLGERAHVLPDPLLLRSVSNAGLLWHFSNSFLVMCSGSPAANLETSWLARKYWNAGRPTLHHTIDLCSEEDGYQIKRRPLAAGLSAVDFEEYVFELKDSEHVLGDSMIFDLYDALISDDWQRRTGTLASELANEAIRRFGDGILDASGYPLLSGEALDFTFWNLVRTEGKALMCIDSKWRSRKPVPVDYLVFRSLFYPLADFLPYLREGHHDALRDVMTRVFPHLAEARFEEHYMTESRFQSVAADREVVLRPAETGSFGTAVLRRL